MLGLSTLTPLCRGDEWTRFRGPNGAGVSEDRDLPTTWSDKENLLWKTELPGAGSSSPIVVGDRVFVTCYSGYGVQGGSGAMSALQRHLVCVNRIDGKLHWTKTIPAEQPEDASTGYLTEHGYASSTPVTDGTSVFVFFGKSGVLAFSLEGEQLWHVNVGKESSNRRWGSGASLILHENLVIVNASEESRSIRALDKPTGKEVWKATGEALELAYGTPNIVRLKNGSSQLVVSVPGEVWGLDLARGKLQWYVENNLTGNICPSVLAEGDLVYVFGGFRSSGSQLLRAGGKGNVTGSHVVWTGRSSSYVATPILVREHLYWIDDRGLAFCVSAKTGELVYREHVDGLEAGGRPVYASPVVADGKLYVVSRWNGVLVLPAEPQYKLIAQNRLSDDSDFNATPAVSHSQLLLRSNRCLYCVALKP